MTTIDNDRFEIASREYIEKDFQDWDEQDSRMEEIKQKKIMKHFRPLPLPAENIPSEDRKVLWKEIA